MKKYLPYILGGLLVVGQSSCATKLYTSYSFQHPREDGSTIHITETKKRVNRSKKGVKLIRYYEIVHPDVPLSFDGVKIAFLSDLHYKSSLKRRGLSRLIRSVNEENPQLLLLGGDFYEGCEHIAHMAGSLGEIASSLGKYAVLGNNDYERCTEELRGEFKKNDIQILEHRVASIVAQKDSLFIAGVKNPFDLQKNGVSPTKGLQDNQFVLLLTHTPDYAEDVSITATDLVLAGHTHGGQVKIFGKSPVIPSKYGERFISGLKYTTSGVPVIITNGVGTSTLNLRWGVPSEMTIITLYRSKKPY